MLKKRFPFVFVAAVFGIFVLWKMQSLDQHSKQTTSVQASTGSKSLLDQAFSTLSKTESSDRSQNLASENHSLKLPIPESNNAPSEKLRVLESILAKANDNDPRLDTVLRNFSVAEKQLIVSKYSQLDPELLNQRGTLVFLLGRELKDSADVQFISDVLHSEPCRSLGRCSEEAKGSHHPEGEIGTDLTLVYPQMVALHSIQSTLQKPNIDEQRKTELKRELETATRSQHPLIAKRANEILQSLRPE